MQRLAPLVEEAQDVDGSALHRAMARYETVQAAAHDAGDTERFRAVSRAYREPLVASLDEAVRELEWALLEEVIEPYHLETSDELPHVRTIIQNATGRYLIRTRIADGVYAIPVAALDYFEAVLRTVRKSQDVIREGLHPYGWGIGHPERDVADLIHTLAEEDVFLANPMLEHAF